MSIMSRLFRKPQSMEANLDEALKEAFRLGEAVDNAARQKAVQLYGDIIRKSPSARIAWFNMGVIQSRMGNWREAIRSFRKAESDQSLGLVAVFARLKLAVENGQRIGDDELPKQFRGENRGGLGVQGPCHNAANELRNRGYECVLEAEGQSCSIHCDTGTGQYTIVVDSLLGMLIKNVYRKEGDKEVNLGAAEFLSEADREIKTLDVGRMPLVQAPVSAVAEASGYRKARQIAERNVGPHGWVRMGRSFDEITKQNAVDAARVGVEYREVTILEDVAKSNWVAGGFLACVLDGEPHALAMLETVQDSSKPTLKSAVERGACVFRAEYFAMPEYPLVHIGLGLPVQFVEGSNVAFAVVENTANFLEANFQDWVSAIEMKAYTLVEVVAPDFTLVASGRTSLDPRVIAEIVENVNKANRHFNTIPEGSRDYSKALDAFYEQHPEPFIWSSQARPMR